MKEFIQNIPKAELHVHLEGTLEPELKLALAKRNGLDIGFTSVEEITKTNQFDSLTSFLKIYYEGMSVLLEERDFYDLAMAYLKKAKQQNIVYVELFFDPQAHTSRGVSIGKVIRGYQKATLEAKQLGVEAKLILCFLRDMSLESAVETYVAALPYRDAFIGIGLDSDERNNPPLKFQSLFERVKEDGFHLTIHCDIDQENSIKHIEDALKVIKVERIDHGTNIVEDETLVEYALKQGIGFTCCPVSNGFVTSDMKGKEIIDLLHRGVKVTINSDDPAYFRSYMVDDLYALATKYHLTKKEISQLVKNAFDISWMPISEKAVYLSQVEAFIEKHL